MTPERIRDLTEEAINETLDGEDLSSFTPDDVKRLFAECIADYLAKVVVAEMGIE